MKLIEVDKLLDNLRKLGEEGDYQHPDEDWRDGVYESIDFVEEAPIVDAEPVRHGKWKPFDEDEYTCSVCGNIFVTMDGEHPLSNEFKYCPFCGAKMDAEEDEE